MLEATTLPPYRSLVERTEDLLLLTIASTVVNNIIFEASIPLELTNNILRAIDWSTNKYHSSRSTKEPILTNFTLPFAGRTKAARLLGTPSHWIAHVNLNLIRKDSKAESVVVGI